MTGVRLVRDALVLRGPVGVCYQGAAGATGKQIASLCFWIALAVLCCRVPFD